MTSYSVSDAVQFVNAVYARGNTSVMDAQGAQIADRAQSMLWNAADWRSTVGELTPFYLTPNEQDFGAPTVVLPSDFGGLRKVDCVQLSSEPAYRYPLNVKRTLLRTYYMAPPNAISYEASLGKFRLYPRVNSMIGPADYMIDGTYKKTPPRITAATLATAACPIDDRFFDVYIKALVYTYLSAVGDPRAGGVSSDKSGRRTQVTGKLAEYYDAIWDAMATESIDLGDDTIAPTEPLIPAGLAW